MTDLASTKFIAGYKHHPEQEEIHWLCNHPQSVDLIFSKDKSSAFVFDDEQSALFEMNEILIAENHPWYTAVAEPFQLPSSTADTDHKQMGLQQAEAKINEYLQLFNERSHNRLKLFLTLNYKDHSIRGYGTGIKLGDAVINFVALLAIKGMRAQCLDKHTFIVKID